MLAPLPGKVTTAKTISKTDQASEIRRCSKDPAYFAKNYIYIKHKDKGSVKFKLWDFQEETLKAFQNNRMNIILKSRQLGITELMGMYVLWFTLFQKDKNVVIVSKNRRQASQIIKRIKYAYKKLPSWLKIVKMVSDNVHTIEFDNDSIIFADATTENAGRGEACSLFIVDEAAFIPELEEMWASVFPTINNGGSCIVGSCVTRDTYILSDKGLQQIEDFIINDKEGMNECPEYNILGFNKLRKGNLIFNNGKVPTKVIHSQHSCIEASLNHKLFSFSNKTNTFNWHTVNELCEDDYVAIQYGHNVWGNSDYCSDFKPEINNKHKNIFNPTVINTDISYFLGLFLSEGSVYKKYKNEKLRAANITISCGDESIYTDLCKLKLHVSKTKNDKIHNTISSKTLVQFLEYLGFDLSKKAKDKIIPKRLLQLSKANIVALLQGIFDGDGTSVEKTGLVSIRLSSKYFIEQIRQLLLNIGITSTFVEGITLPTKKVKVCSKYYGLELNKYQSKLFYELIGFRIHRKQIKQKKLDRQIKQNNVLPNSKTLFNYLLSFYKGSYRSLRSAFNVRTDFISGKSKEQVKLLYNVVKKYLSDTDTSYFENILSDKLIWSKIKKTIDSENDTYDFSLPSVRNDEWDHSVIYNGIVGHQTPNGGAGQFYNLYINAPENGFNKIKLDWDCHPERNQEWYEETKRSMSPKKFAQEFLCVNGEAKVFTKNGYKEIKNINVGEEVLTHKGRFKKVIKTYKSIVNKQELVTIKSPLSKNYEFQITKNHPFLVAEKSDKLPLTNNIRKYIKTNNFIQNWKCLYELDLNPVVRNFENAIFPVFNLSQTYKDKIIDLAKLCIHSDISEGLIRYVNQCGWTKRYIDIDYDLGKFIGLFLAEGSYQDTTKKVSLAFDSSEENLIEFIKNFYTKYSIKFHIKERIKKKNKAHCTIVTTSNKFIKNVLQLYIDGQYCYEKVLKDVCFELDKSVIKGIIDGLWLGDGYHIPTTKNVLSITSEKLIYQIRILMSAFGCITRIDQKDLNIKNNKLLPQFLLELNDVKYRTIEKCTENAPDYINGSRSILANDFWWAKSWIKEYNESETLDVYNIEVEEDNSYCLVGLVVHNCSFLLSGDTVVEGEDILRHEKSICDPKEEMGPERAVWKWKNYNPEHRYLISADTARGDGEDFSAFTVINADTLEIVCEYKGKIKVNKFAELLAYIGYEYGTCLIVVENNTYGLAVLVKLIEMKYPVIYGEEKGGKVYSEGHVDWDLDDVVPGFRTDIASRVLSVDKLEESFRLDKVITYSKRLIDELRNFIYENGKPQARKNANDDIVISLAIGLYVCSYVFGSKDSDTQLTKKLLETIRRIDQSINYKTINEPGFSSEGNIYKQNPSDPYSAIYRDQVVDFRWVINNHKSEKKVENKGISFLGVLR